MARGVMDAAPGWVMVERAAAHARAAMHGGGAADGEPAEIWADASGSATTALLPTSHTWSSAAAPSPAPPHAATPHAATPPPSRFHLLGSQLWPRLCNRVGGALGIWPNTTPVDYHQATALVTGAASPVGEAFANHLVARGVTTLLLADHSPHALAPLVTRLHAARAATPTLPPLDARALSVDLAKPGAGRTLVAGLMHDGHHIDVLVHNAGFAEAGRFDLINWLTDVDTLQVNFLSAIELTKEALPGMRHAGRGVIVSVAAEGAFEAVPYAATWGSAKSGLVSFTGGLHQELQGTGVRAAVLCGPPPQPQRSWLPWRRKDPPKPTGVTPERAVVEALQGIDEGQCYIIPTGITLWKNQLLHELPGMLATQLARRLHPHVASEPAAG